MKIHSLAKPITLTANSDREFILIHGYTGSPSTFRNLALHLHKRFNATVKVPLLKGHGTKIEDLENLHYEDFYKQIEEIVKADLKKGKKIVIGGLSFGAQLALHLSSNYPVNG